MYKELQQHDTGAQHATFLTVAIKKVAVGSGREEPVMLMLCKNLAFLCDCFFLCVCVCLYHCVCVLMRLCVLRVSEFVIP